MGRAPTSVRMERWSYCRGMNRDAGSALIHQVMQLHAPGLPSILAIQCMHRPRSNRLTASSWDPVQAMSRPPSSKPWPGR